MRTPTGSYTTTYDLTDEAQLTQILAGFADSDPAFASSFARVLVAAAPRPEPRTFGEIPPELDCVAEHPVFDQVRDLGHVDLCFRSEPDDFELFVELKIHSGYGYEQLDRYLAALEAYPRARQGLIAVTRNLPSYGEERIAPSPLWLGSVRWRRIYENLSSLRHRDPVLAKLWPPLLTLLRHQGDFGLMDFDPDSVRGWARWKEGRRVLTEMLNELYEPALEMVRVQLGEAAGAPPSEGLATAILYNDKRLVWPWGESLNIQFAVPATNGERLRLEFVGGQDEPAFCLGARHEDAEILRAADKRLLAATDELEAKGFEAGRFWGSYWRRPHLPDEWLDKGSEATTALLALAKADLRDLLASGLLEALPPGTKRPDEPKAS